jgi:hypothetical protein
MFAITCKIQRSVDDGLRTMYWHPLTAKDRHHSGIWSEEPAFPFDDEDAAKKELESRGGFGDAHDVKIMADSDLGKNPDGGHLT